MAAADGAEEARRAEVTAGGGRPRSGRGRARSRGVRKGAREGVLERLCFAAPGGLVGWLSGLLLPWLGVEVEEALVFLLAAVVVVVARTEKRRPARQRREASRQRGAGPAQVGWPRAPHRTAPAPALFPLRNRCRFVATLGEIGFARVSGGFSRGKGGRTDSKGV